MPSDTTSRIYDPAKHELATILHTVLSAKLGSVQVDLTFESIHASLERPKERAMGDFALPCFRFGKALRCNPAQLANELVEQLDQAGSPWIKHVEAKGAFLNIFVCMEYLAHQLIPKIIGGQYFQVFDGQHKTTKVMIEYSAPNTHKEFHVGHVRNVVLGDAVCRLFAYCGYAVHPVNYIGDEGTHVAKCLWELARRESAGQERGTLSFTEWYGDCYKGASIRLAEAPAELCAAHQAEIGAILTELETKKGPAFERWVATRQDCLEEFERIYSWLGVHFEHIFYESELTDEAQQIVDEYISRGLFTESQGAIGIDMEPYQLGYFMARKSDGTTLYMTKDLVLARWKFEEFDIARSIYVVANEQDFHFKQLFKALDLMGFENAKNCFHLSYAHVTLPEGKMSSRKGNVFTFNQLRELLLTELQTYLAKYQGEWDPSELAESGNRLAVGALKYGMLMTDPGKEIVFDPQVWTSFEGHSGPYLMYTYARTRSILRKCAEKGYHLQVDNLELLKSSAEHELLTFLYDFNDSVLQACENYKPSVLANHLFSMCRSFNRFYAESPVLNAEDADVRSARIALLEAFSQTLRGGLTLLGITPVERM